MLKFKSLGGRVWLATALLVAFTGLVSAAPILSFSSVENASVAFTGSDNSFTFAHGVGGDDFVVTLDNGGSPWPGGAGSLIGYLGDINGTWTIANTNTGPGQTTVSGVGTLTLYNQAKTAWVSGKLEWLTMGAVGQVGGININGALNFYDLALGGTVTDANLAYLESVGGANAVISFQGLTIGPPPVPDGSEFEDCGGLLGQIRCSDNSSASYSGTLEVAEAPVPEPSTMLLSGMALLALGLMRKRVAKRS